MQPLVPIRTCLQYSLQNPNLSKRREQSVFPRQGVVLSSRPRPVFLFARRQLCITELSSSCDPFLFLASFCLLEQASHNTYRITLHSANMQRVSLLPSSSFILGESTAHSPLTFCTCHVYRGLNHAGRHSWLIHINTHICVSSYRRDLLSMTTGSKETKQYFIRTISKSGRSIPYHGKTTQLLITSTLCGGREMKWRFICSWFSSPKKANHPNTRDTRRGRSIHESKGERRLEKETSLHSKKHSIPTSTRSREGRSIHRSLHLIPTFHSQFITLMEALAELLLPSEQKSPQLIAF